MSAKITLQNPKGPISGAEAVVRSLIAEGADLDLWISWWCNYASL